jgi:hypothetical protein
MSQKVSLAPILPSLHFILYLTLLLYFQAAANQSAPGGLLPILIPNSDGDVGVEFVVSSFFVFTRLTFH